MDTSSIKSPFFICYKAAQVKLGDKGFLSRDIAVRDLLLNRGDVHHVYPRQHLKDKGLTPSSYNQIANYVIAQSEINIAIGAKAPETYFAELHDQGINGGQKYGGIQTLEDMRANLETNCVPSNLLDGVVPSYEEFLKARRQLMGQKIKTWFSQL